VGLAYDLAWDRVLRSFSLVCNRNEPLKEPPRSLSQISLCLVFIFHFISILFAHFSPGEFRGWLRGEWGCLWSALIHCGEKYVAHMLMVEKRLKSAEKCRKVCYKILLRFETSKKYFKSMLWKIKWSYGNNPEDFLIFIRTFKRNLKHVENLGPVTFITFIWKESWRPSHIYKDV